MIWNLGVRIWDCAPLATGQGNPKSAIPKPKYYFDTPSVGELAVA